MSTKSNTGTKFKIGVKKNSSRQKSKAIKVSKVNQPKGVKRV